MSDGGNGYILTMELGTIVFSNVSATGAQAVVPFTIKEQSENPQIPETTTDTGTIACEMVKLQGQWLCRTMTITFDTGPTKVPHRAGTLPESGNRLVKHLDDSNAGTTGFGFGKLTS
ncbi:MAG: hypothetical protein GXX08_10580 [Firmicutes bacterium]|nr:hypothetical protein [Bacillota bacterium]